MKRNDGEQEFVWGIYKYHAKAIAYRCPSCGYEKLGTCKVQFWEDDCPVETEEAEEKTADTKKPFFSTIASFFTEAFKTISVDETEMSETDQKDDISLSAINQPDPEDLTKPEDTSKSKEDAAPVSKEEITEFKPKAEKNTIKKETEEKNEKKMDKPVAATVPDKKEAEGKSSKVDITKSDKEDAKKEDLKAAAEKPESKDKDEGADETQPLPEEKTAPKMFETVNGKTMLSDDWIDYMFENHPKSFRIWYDRFASMKQKERHYINRHKPQISVILNDTLYDTDKAQMYLAGERKIENETRKMKIYHYITPSRRFFKVLCVMGRSDELVIMDEGEVKKLLSHYPDIYKKIITDRILE